MTITGIEIVKARVERKINFESKYSTYNRRRIFKRAYSILNNDCSVITFSQALKQSWTESKKVISESRFELTKLREQLNSMFTPVQYNQTSEAQTIAFNNMMNKVTTKIGD